MFWCLENTLLVICLIIVGLVIDLGGAPNHDRLGFRYWKDPGLFSERYATGSLGRFLGIWKSVGTAVYTFSGIQSVCLLLVSQNIHEEPFIVLQKSFYRIAILYFTTVLVLSMIVSHTDPAISKPDGTARGSAFVVAIQRSGN